mgnify:CR=1 FL=1
MIPEYGNELPAIVKEHEENAQAQVIVISSTGPHFAAGNDTAVYSNNAVQCDDPKVDEKQRRTHGAKLYDTVAVSYTPLTLPTNKKILNT